MRRRSFRHPILALIPLLAGCGDGAVPVPGGSVVAPPLGPEACWSPPPPSDAPAVTAGAPRVRYVDPFIGTGGVGFGAGSAFPGPQVPFGMIRPGPDTAVEGIGLPFSHCAGYAYDDAHIYGFSQTRMHGTGIVDYGTVALMPTLGMTAAKASSAGHRQSFSKATEQAAPGYYAVTLGDGITVELTAGERVALHRYRFPTGSDATVLVDIGHALPSVTIVDGLVDIDAPAQRISGMAHFAGGYSGRYGGMPVYFAARFSQPFITSGVWKAGVLAEGEASRAGGDTGAWAKFDASGGAEVEVAIAVSFIDVAHALENLETEAPDFDFDGRRAATEAAWEAELGRLEVEADTEDELRITYTALYHALLMPTLATEADGSYRGLDREVHQAEGFRYYTDFSLWDTYRTLHPLLTLIDPERQGDMLSSLAVMAEQSSVPPQWVLGTGETLGMLGDSAAVVLGDSLSRGVSGVGADSLYQRLLAHGAQGGGRDMGDELLAMGYVPMETGGSSGSKTLEYAVDDFALARAGEQLGRDAAEVAALDARAGSWKNLWDAESGFLLGRRADGSFPREDDPTRWQDYWAEGATWHYTWFAPHDVPGLAETMGGREAMLAKLDAYFALSSCQETSKLLPKPYYWHSNEPVLFVPWAYAALDDAARTATWVRWAMDDSYGTGPDGLPGNDDGGTMSAWWLFAAAGIFPDIGTADWLLTAPRLRKVVLHLPGGTLTVTTTGVRGGHPVAATFDGQALARPRIAHAQLAGGGELVVELAAEPGPWR
jgi:predicted alpha-1,2-mannosidase